MNPLLSLTLHLFGRHFILLLSSLVLCLSFNRAWGDARGRSLSPLSSWVGVSLKQLLQIVNKAQSHPHSTSTADRRRQLFTTTTMGGGVRFLTQMIKWLVVVNFSHLWQSAGRAGALGPTAVRTGPDWRAATWWSAPGRCDLYIWVLPGQNRIRTENRPKLLSYSTISNQHKPSVVQKSN